MLGYVFGLTLLLRSCATAVIRDAASPDAAVNTTVVYQFGTNVIPENLILRPNGQLLVDANSQNQVYQLDPNLGSSQPLRVVHTFPGVKSLFGFATLGPDVYVVATGNFTLTGGATPGSWSLWTLDLTAYQAPTYDASKVIVKQVVTPVPSVGAYDGIAVINATAGIVAATDFTKGTIWNLDVLHNKVTTLVSSTQLQGVSGSTFDQVGANGLKIRGNQLYYTVTGRKALGSVQVDTKTGQAISSLQTIFNYGVHLDDFNIAPSGNIYLSTLDTNPGGGILRRSAGTPTGQNGTSLVVSEFGTNALIFQKNTASACTLIILAGLQNQVSKATLPGAC